MSIDFDRPKQVIEERLMFARISPPLKAAISSTVLVFLSGCGGEPQAAAPPPVPVEVTRVSFDSVESSDTFNARLRAQQVAEIRPQVSGQVSQVFVDLGDFVVQGDPLFAIDPSQQAAVVSSRQAAVRVTEASRANALANLRAEERELDRIRAEQANLSEGSLLSDARSQVAAARAELARRQAVLDYSRKEEKRYRELADGGAVARERYDEAVRDLQQAQADVANQADEVRSAEAAVGAAGRDLDRRQATLDAQIATQNELISAAALNVATIDEQIQQAEAEVVEGAVELGYYSVRAPFDGVIGEVPVKTGDYATPQTELTTVNQNQPLEVLVDIPIEAASRIRQGMTVELLYPNGESVGISQVSFVAPEANSDTQTVQVKALYGNALGELRTDELVRARVIWEEEEGITVPFASVTRIGDQAFVFVVDLDSEAEGRNAGGDPPLVVAQVPVKLGALQNQSYEVISGVEAGDRIVSSGVQKLSNNTPVVIRAEDSATNSTRDPQS
ncbi:MAG: efflux RND transporter periplasmic adaptor subunit [Cyanobacteriota bacterium]|nr:efflux RND transporter periplasmic adaptor subunit [Cyanobacteriota bacterium]